MNQFKIDFQYTNIKNTTYKKYEDKLKEEIKQLKKTKKTNYENIRSSINLPFDETIINKSKKLSKKLNDAQTIIIIGIGGSNLGTIAIYEALKGKLYNQKNKKKVYFLDTVDNNLIEDISIFIKNELKENRKVVLNVISKSGTTTETIANFKYLLNIIQKNATYNYKDYIVITTDYDSTLEQYGKQNQYNILNIPKKVGGRFSVFSHVGIFPLTFLGINCTKIIEGAKEVEKISFSTSINTNKTMKSAITIYRHNKLKKNIFNTFLFSNQLESIGKWYRQLLAESIGKKYNLNNKKINTGITPIISIGSTDLHSMGQLYIAGPNDKLHCFVNIKKKKEKKLIPNKKLDNIVKNIKNIDTDKIMQAIFNGTINAFKNNKIPIYTIEIDKIDEFNIGYFMQFKMFEIIFLGALFNINTFNQPNVEEYKKITKKILSKKTNE